MQSTNAPNHILFCQGLNSSITAEMLTEVFMRYPGLTYFNVNQEMCVWLPRTLHLSNIKINSKQATPFLL